MCSVLKYLSYVLSLLLWHTTIVDLLDHTIAYVQSRVGAHQLEAVCIEHSMYFISLDHAIHL
ncbi:MAG: hypothetical protein PWR26_729 [Methanosarcinales archaeon]|nr:hypothetical protein [Methanosarcinales archaeon]MDN5295608.1 hypothetical protein [Methanosarcinales archaeon]